MQTPKLLEIFHFFSFFNVDMILFSIFCDKHTKLLSALFFNLGYFNDFIVEKISIVGAILDTIQIH